MKMVRWARMLAVCAAIAAILAAATTPVSRQAAAGEMTFTFNLDGSYKTSAGAYKPDGTLVRTLWNNRACGLGTHEEVWDGKDDYGKAVPDGTYEIHLIRHNVTYTWEGVIGNSSKNKTGNLVHLIFSAVPSMAISGTKAFYTDAYGEGLPSLIYFDTTDPQVRHIIPGNRDAGVSPYVAADEETVYWAYHGVYWGEPPTHPEHNAWVAARNISDWSVVKFAAGQLFGSGGASENTTNPARFVYPSVIDRVTSPPETPHVSGSRKVEPSGLAVQRSGNFLFVAHHNLNAVHVLDKTTGQLITKATFTQPRQLAAQSAGRIWLIHDVNGVGTVQKCVVNADGSLTPDIKLSGLGQPIALAVSYDDSLVLAADRATSQVQAFRSSDGVLQWTLGQKGGYGTDSVVTNDRFDWSSSPVFLACAPDGSFWVGDTGNLRMIEFDREREYVTAIHIMPGARSYASTADLSDSTRVFAGSLEYKIDYSQPLGPTSGWKLVRNWWYPNPHHWCPGIHSAATLPNGRTYATILTQPLSPEQNALSLYELPAKGIARDTGVRLHPNSAIYPDGSNRYIAVSNGVVQFLKRPIEEFDEPGNPVYGPPEMMASAPAPDNQGPYWHGAHFKHRLYQTSGGVITSLGETRTGVGPFHLGGIKPGATNWLWLAFREINDGALPVGKWNGGFQIGGGIGNAAAIQVVEGRDIVVAFYGESWHGGQANQHVHFYENGLFLGQFGVFNPPSSASPGVIAGASGNSFAPSLVKANGKLYYYVNDEFNASGLHRWCIDGADRIEELSGRGTLGSAIKLAPLASGK